MVTEFKFVDSNPAVCGALQSFDAGAALRSTLLEDKASWSFLTSRPGCPEFEHGLSVWTVIQNRCLPIQSMYKPRACTPEEGT